ncbi:MAG TPA: Rpn family recombination-promoting nuclease/putative transposase [Candidatus Wallbacteria bacterium]|nr:Rpn family recombination-promoting nuclease/putative transposase [Candidatus Wallbacteria bacterium]
MWYNILMVKIKADKLKEKKGAKNIKRRKSRALTLAVKKNTAADENKTYGFLNDIIFKYVFGSEANKSLLTYLLNALLHLEGPNRITIDKMMNPFNLAEFTQDKFTLVDVKAKDEAGKRYTIEVQLLSHENFIERAIYYLAKLYTGQLKKNGKFTEIKKTIGISIVDFELLPQERAMQNVYRFTNELSMRTLTDSMELQFVELVKFDKDKPKSLRTPLEKWLHVLKFGDIYGKEGAKLPKELESEEGVMEAISVLKKANSNGKMRGIIESREKAEHVIATRMHSAFNNGRIEGKIEGKIDAAKIMLGLGLTKTEVAAKLGLKETDF